ncbi:MAG TPA: histidine--tRNA ligase [Candidatus Saccharibacteria bacterium]|nr:histidine--tRNA ligase [Candidatus Saccharibacteria bacterium]
MTLSTQPYKGARDFYPEDKRLQKYLFSTMRRVVESFGYEEYDAPILESLDLYTAKTGEEIVNEQTYVFKDRGGRSVVIRPEMTPSVSRMVAGRRQELGYPVRWYSIPNLWRYERPQRGRLREHWQLNVDIFGLAGLEAEHEAITVGASILNAFGAKQSMYGIRINSRQLINHFLNDILGLDAVQQLTTIKLIDRMHKMEHVAFVASIDAILVPSQREAGVGERILGFLSAQSLAELPDDLRAHESTKKLIALLAMLEESSVHNARFDATVMRGFDYYTDIVFEMFDTNPENNRSMFGGGRYDGLVGLFGVEPVPTVGFGLGDVTLANFIESHGLTPKLRSETDVYAILVGDVYKKAQNVVSALREEGVRVAVDATGRKPAQQIKVALKKEIPYALFIGDKELEEGRYTLKELASSNEQMLSVERIVSAVLDSRH